MAANQASCTIAIPTFGDLGFWAPLAARACSSANAQTVRCNILRLHGHSLYQARNEILRQVETERVVFLDADDELPPDYVERMLTGSADVRAPAVVYIQADGKILQGPRVPNVAGHVHACEPNCLAFGNYIVIGAMVRTDVLRRAGGWPDYPVYEDYAAWLGCYRLGATIESVPSAVYRAHVRPLSRNRGTPRAVRHATHQQIARDYGVPVPP